MSDELPDRRKQVRRMSDAFNPAVSGSTEISEKASSTAKDLRSQLRTLVGTTILLWGVIAFLVWWIWSQSQSNTHALCAIRIEAQNRVEEGQAYLKEHPTGALGLSRAQIQQSIKSSVDTVNALHNLGSC